MYKRRPTMRHCVSEKQREILRNSRTGDLAGKNQQEGSWKRQKRSPRNWGSVVTVTARRKVTMAHQTTVQAMEEVTLQSTVMTGSSRSVIGSKELRVEGAVSRRG